MRTTVHLALITALLLAAPGCRYKVKESAILDVRPKKLQQGDFLLVEGRPFHKRTVRNGHLPDPVTFAAVKAKTTVLLQGEFTDAKGHKETRAIKLPAVAVPSAAHPRHADRVLVLLTDAIKHDLGWVRFAGRVGVRQVVDGAARPVLWTQEKQTIRLNFFPPSQRSLAQVTHNLGNDMLMSWLGIKVRPVDRGLRIEQILPAKPKSKVARQLQGMFGAGAARKLRATFKVGDVLILANNTKLHSKAHFTKAVRDAQVAAKLKLKKGRPSLSIQATRGTEAVTARVSLAKSPFITHTTWTYLVIMLICGLICLAVSLGLAGVLTLVERRVAARMQFRIGPNRVGPNGLFQFMADGIKLVLKEDIIPAAVDKNLFKLAPYLVLMGVFGTFVVLPFGQFFIVADLDMGILYLMAITGFVALGLMMAGWASNNKWSLLGGMRAAAQIISYEIPTGLSLMVPVVLAGTLSTQSIVEQQGGLPWQWFAFDNPFLFISFIIYFISALAEGNRTPFDLPEAESELVSGYNIEYSGWRFAVFFTAEWANLFVIGAVATTVFLGGWQIPGISAIQHGMHWYWQVLGVAIFFAKSLALVFVIIWIRWTLPRFRVDQLMTLCWKYFVPWTFASIIFAAAWTWIAPDPRTSYLRMAVGVLTFALCGIGLGYAFWTRVVFNWKQNPEKRWSWDPFYFQDHAKEATDDLMDSTDG